MRFLLAKGEVLGTGEIRGNDGLYKNVIGFEGCATDVRKKGFACSLTLFITFFTNVGLRCFEKGIDYENIFISLKCKIFSKLLTKFVFSILLHQQVTFIIFELFQMTYNLLLQRYNAFLLISKCLKLFLHMFLKNSNIHGIGLAMRAP